MMQEASPQRATESKNRDKLEELVVVKTGLCWSRQTLRQIKQPQNVERLEELIAIPGTGTTGWVSQEDGKAQRRDARMSVDEDSKEICSA
jgi:hypothetical protein